MPLSLEEDEDPLFLLEIGNKVEKKTKKQQRVAFLLLIIDFWIVISFFD